MTLEIVLPEFKESKKVKDLIISILADNYPLTLKKIYNQIKKRYSLNVSYQAVHKTINELISKEVVKKYKKEYKLNIKWIKAIKEFSEKIEKKYRKESFLVNSGNFTTDNVWELYPIFIDLFKKNIFKANNKPICFISNIVLNPQLGSEKELEAYRMLAKKYKWIMVARNNSLLDRIWKRYWERLGAKIKINAKININPAIDTFVVGDYVIQIFHTEKVVKKIKELAEKVKKLSDIRIEDIQDIYFKNYGKIHVVATKNKELASSLRKKCESLFR